MTDVFARVGGSWVGNAGDPNNPPPDEQPKWAGHIPNRVILGMCVQQGSSPTLGYTEAVSYTGPVFARRDFQSGWITANGINSWLNTCTAQSVYPWISFKVPSNNWAGVPNGQYDSGLDIILERAAARSEQWTFTVHHEPNGDGDLGVWAEMQEYISNYVASASDKVCYAPIMNGFPWGPRYYDAGMIAEACPPSLISTLNANNHLLAVDCYDSPNPDNLSYTQFDRTSLKMTGFINWARANGVQSCGFGEWGMHDAEDLRRAWNIQAQNCDIVGLSVYFNSGANSRANWLLVPDAFNPSGTEFDGTALTEARLDMFVAALAESENANPSTIAP